VLAQRPKRPIAHAECGKDADAFDIVVRDAPDDPLPDPDLKLRVGEMKVERLQGSPAVGRNLRRCLAILRDRSAEMAASRGIQPFRYFSHLPTS
jgi:hypothetical protein